ncbi:BTB domain-containing protein [Mycena indigotica]|uniref:BTB domain-containing protein n=1 Tax=Mycena indigotica TaxID=2126181 RepID=A0A8H6TED0_9AGAR|nr:BTB domain-containing protein [Mycena indigotica]KAF7315147.1 BTB domain-containing protein [Mycena indigotica]
MSSCASPAAKRPRTEDTSEVAITRSEIWYLDGSVVLQAANIQFRVHFGLLAAQSTVFSDMYAMPQPEEQSELVDGCPLLEVQDDPQDVKNLLSVLYTPALLLQTPLPLSFVASLLRLGAKYEFRDLLVVAVKWIHRQFPSTLEDFLARKDSTNPIASSPGLLFDVLELATEHDIQCSLPCIYYDIMQTPKREWVDGLIRPSRLRTADLRTCLVGFDKLSQAQFQDGYVFSWMHKRPSTENCLSLRVCSEERRNCLRRYNSQEQRCSFITSFNVDRPRNQLSKYCSPCQQEIGDLLDAGRRKGWEDLPGVFGLPAWRDLKSGLP